MISASSTVAKPAELWNWVLAKQGLSIGTRRLTVAEVADATLGLHAARLPSPFATAAARTVSEADLTCLLGQAGDPELITVRCMRKTLHTLPIQLAAVAQVATEHYRLRDLACAIRRAHVTDARLSAAKDYIRAELAQGARSHRALETAGETHRFSRAEVRLTLKWLWEHGEVTYRNQSPSWHRERRTFALRKHTHPHFERMLCDRWDAQTALLGAYFGRYGPATVTDAAWWSGLSQARVRTALRELDVIALRLPWADSPFFMCRQAYEQYELVAGSAPLTGVNYLAHEDVALKAYFESRRRYLGSVPARKVFNQIGEVLPSIVLDGQVIGRWQWHPGSRTVRYRHFDDVPLTTAMRHASRLTARWLQLRLRTGHSL